MSFDSDNSTMLSYSSIPSRSSTSTRVSAGPDGVQRSEGLCDGNTVLPSGEQQEKDSLRCSQLKKTPNVISNLENNVQQLDLTQGSKPMEVYSDSMKHVSHDFTQNMPENKTCPLHNNIHCCHSVHNVTDDVGSKHFFEVNIIRPQKVKTCSGNYKLGWENYRNECFGRVLQRSGTLSKEYEQVTQCSPFSAVCRVQPCCTSPSHPSCK